MNELLKYDENFSKELFLSKVNNIYVMICMSIMENDLRRIDHFVNDEVYNGLKDRLNILNSNNLIQMFGELNVANTSILYIEEKEDRFVIGVELVSKYLDYTIDKYTKEYKDGDRQNRKLFKNRLILEKMKNKSDLGTVRKCPSCGAPMDLNNTGICEYCNEIFKQDNYDWLLVKLEIENC